MPTVLDSLALELGLDSSQFADGLREAVTNVRKAHDETVRQTKDLQHEVGDKLTEAFHRAILEITAFGAALIGARSLVEFTANVTRAGANMSTLSSTLGMAPEKISSFQQAMEEAGATTEGATAALMKVNDVVQGIKIGTVQTTSMFHVLSLHKDALENILDTVESLNNGMGPAGNISAEELALRVSKLRNVVGDAATATALITQGTGAVRAQMAASEQRGYAVTKEQVDAASKLLSAWVNLSAAATAFARTVETDVANALTLLIGDLQTLFDENSKTVSNWIGDRIKEIDAWIKNPGNWQRVGQEFQDFKAWVDQIVTALGGWHKAIEDLLLLLTAAKIGQIISGLMMIGRALAFISGVSLLSSAAGPAAAGALGITELIGVAKGAFWTTGGAIMAAIAAMTGMYMARGDSLVTAIRKAARAEMQGLSSNPMGTAADPLRQPYLGFGKPPPDLSEAGRAAGGIIAGGGVAAAGRRPEVEITASGRPVSPSSPLPVQIIGQTDAVGMIPISGPSDSSQQQTQQPSSSHPIADTIGGWAKSARSWFSGILGAGGAKASPSPPSQPSGAVLPPSQSFGTSSAATSPVRHPPSTGSWPTNATPLPPGVAPHASPDIIIDGKHYRANPDGTVGPEIHSYLNQNILSSANRFALDAVSHVRGGNRSVQVASINFHDASGAGRISSGDALIERLRRDLTSINMDVGLA